MSRILIYGDVSVNVIDGSSIWLASVAEVASRLFDEVHVLLKFSPANDVVIGQLRRHPRVVLHHPDESIALSAHGGHTPESAAEHAARLSSQSRFDVILVRGMEACWAFVRRHELAAVLWSYVTDLAFPPEKLSKNNLNRIGVISDKSRALFAQTESARSYLEAIAPAAAGKTSLMSPMVPESAFEVLSSSPPPGRTRLELIYSGKFAREWRTLEILELPKLLRQYGIDARLTMVGAKFQKNKQDRTWDERMRRALEEAHAAPDSGVEWLGGLTRQQSVQAMARSHIGIGWRSPELDSSLEVSTKALEYGAAGAVPLINRTLDHEALYSVSYGGFVRGDTDVRGVADAISSLVPNLPASRALARSVSDQFSMQRASERLGKAFSRAGIPVLSDREPALLHTVVRAKRVLIASHDFKFMGEIVAALKSDPHVELAIDAWPSLHVNNAEQSESLLSSADVVLCEWAGPNLVWYSKRVRDDQRLVSRLHGFEVRTGTWLPEVAVDRIAALTVVSDLYRDLVLRALPVTPEQVKVVPNLLDASDLSRPKLPGSQFRLGVAGFVPFLKRPDRAVDVLAQLLDVDERYSLHFRGRAPWEYPHVWRDAVQRQQSLETYRRIASSPRLRSRVVFEPFGADMGSWLRKIGIMLSPSDTESFHLAAAEGLASGSAAIVWERPGAAEIFGLDRVVESTESAVAKILQLAPDGDYGVVSHNGRREAALRWDLDVVLPQWWDLLGLPPRRLGESGAEGRL